MTPPPLVVSLHDVHPGSRVAVQAQRAALLAVGVVRASLLAVPWWHGGSRLADDPALAGWLRERVAAGDEVLLHGWRHDCHGLPGGPRNWFWQRFYTAGEAEFHRLDQPEAKRRLAAGLEELARAGLAARGFVAPAWLSSPGTRSALAELGFAHTCDLHGAERFGHPSRAGRSHCWSCRAAWRRTTSLAYNAALARHFRRRPPALLRLSLHPADHAHPAVTAQMLRLAQAALAAGSPPATYAQALAT